MGMTKLTAIIIKTNPLVKCDAGGPDKDGKYVGWIMLDVDRWHPLLNTEPIYSSNEEAIKAMQLIVDKIRARATNLADLIGVVPLPAPPCAGANQG